MEEERLLKKMYLEHDKSDDSELSKEELLSILQKSDKLYTSELYSLVYKVWKREYDYAYSQYCHTVKEETDKIMDDIKIFKQCLDKTEKVLIFKEIAKRIDGRILADQYSKVSDELLYLIKYGFEIEDVHSVVILMRMRKEIMDYRRGYDSKKMPSYYDGLDARELYKKLIKMVVEQCDDETARIYIQDLADEKYFKLSHVTERGGWYIYKKDIIETYKFYKEQKELHGEVLKI